MKNSIPILTGRLVDKKDGSKDKFLVVWCPVCNIEHTHGWPEASMYSVCEHRVAHCDSGALKDTGYYIMPNDILETAAKVSSKMKAKKK